MEFERALEFVKSFVSYENKQSFAYDEANFDLGRFREFLTAYGVDPLQLRCVHVAGSKGKGTICKLMAEYLCEKGMKVGLFTSPYMFDIRECFWISGALISREDFVGYVKGVKELLQGNPELSVTYFEILTAMMFKYFLDQGVEFAVIEVGMGGRLDSTNVVMPELAVLARVEEEHLGILGDNLEEILGEKLGIVKAGVPVLVGDQSEEVLKMIEGKGFKIMEFGEAVGAFERNAETAKQALEQIWRDVDEDLWQKVVKDFSFVGRFDVRDYDGKTVVFDMAHTESSVRDLVLRLRREFEGREFKVLFSMMRGKAVEECMAILRDLSSEFVFTNSHEERGIPAEELGERFGGEVVEDAKEAFELCLSELKREQVLVVTGSHFLVAKVLES